ncbi:C4-dicarboxylate transporter DcuC, partial [Pantoea ananatis]|uniref:C4-dicarboxylate transporter DcuC n=1 Tax=Pantoea ananas TaxID=553 RepID=UPI0024ADD054
ILMWLMKTLLTSRCINQRGAGHKDGFTSVISDTAEMSDTKTSNTPRYYVLLPLVPVFLVLLLSPLAITSIHIDVVTAMIAGTLIAFFTELVTTRDFKASCAGLQVFFQGMGNMFTSIVSLLVCAEIFAQGLQKAGAIDYLINSVKDVGMGFNGLTVIMTALVGLTAVLTGSGVAAFFSFSSLAPTVAAKFGTSAVKMLLPMQMMAGMGRAISPVSGIIIAVSKAGECSPVTIVKRTFLPAVAVCLRWCWLVVYCSENLMYRLHNLKPVTAFLKSWRYFH